MVSQFARVCATHSHKAQQWLIQQINASGKLTDYPDDLVCYYKLPYLLTVNGEHILANHLLNYMKATFFSENNSFTFNLESPEFLPNSAVVIPSEARDLSLNYLFK